MIIEKAISKRKGNSVIRFIFLSRIMQDKGCDYILTAVRNLNEKGLQGKFIVDFYGKIDLHYKKSFMDEMEKLPNVNYHGLLDLRTKEGYDILSSYHAMLFPTYHPTAGFSGIFIDAFIAGIPVLASGWAYNKESIKDGEFGVIYPVHDIEALMNTMENCIDENNDLYSMAVSAPKEASKYSSENALSEDYLRSLGLVE